MRARSSRWGSSRARPTSSAVRSVAAGNTRFRPRKSCVTRSRFELSAEARNVGRFMDSSGYTVAVDEDGICLLRSPWDAALKRAIRAIPGRFWDEELHGWTIRLTPDRAESVARLLRSFPVFTAELGAMEMIEAYRDRRNLRKPMIEGVTPDDEYCLSLCDDWVHPVLDEMRRFFRPRPHPEIGRLSVPVTDETRNPLLTLIERNDVGLHMRARQRLQPAPAVGTTRRAAVVGLPQRSSWRGWVSTTITDDRPYFVFATRGGGWPPAAQPRAGRAPAPDPRRPPLLRVSPARRHPATGALRRRRRAPDGRGRARADGRPAQAAHGEPALAQPPDAGRPAR